MHGIVYVPESEAPSDPLENEGASTAGLPGRDGIGQQREYALIYGLLLQSSNLRSS